MTAVMTAIMTHAHYVISLIIIGIPHRDEALSQATTLQAQLDNLTGQSGAREQSMLKLQTELEAQQASLHQTQDDLAQAQHERSAAKHAVSLMVIIIRTPVSASARGMWH